MSRCIVLMLLAALSAAACHGSTMSPATTSPSAPSSPASVLTLHAEVSDPAGDALAYPGLAHSPDLTSATVDVSGGNITFAVRFAAGTFDAATTLIIIELDTDQNTATGRPLGNVGADYALSMGNGQGADALVGNYADPAGTFATIATVPVAFVADGMNVTLPLSILGHDDGRLNFVILSYTHQPGMMTSNLLDEMPEGMTPGQIQ